MPQPPEDTQPHRSHARSPERVFLLVFEERDMIVTFEAIHRRRPSCGPVLLGLALVMAMVLAATGQAWARDATPAPGGTPVDATNPAAERAVAYLIAQQGSDGGFVGFSGKSDPGTTTGAIVALRAAAFRGAEVQAAIAAAADYLEREGPVYASTGSGQAANVALAAIAAGRDPAGFGGEDLMLAIGSANPDTGLHGNGVYDHALVILALAAAGTPISPTDIEALHATRLDDGSWAFDGSTAAGAGDSNTTALVVQALVASGNGTDPMVAAALDFLKTVQTDTGQFAYQPADPLAPDANSTALAVQAIVATGQDPTAADWRDAASGLTAFQNPSGAFRYQDAEPADNLLATLQALPALAGLPLPVATACPNLTATGTAEAEANAATPVIALPAPGRGQVPCVELEAA